MKVGITGGMGSGKSVVSRMLRAMGYKVYDADNRAKTICNTNDELKQRLTDEFGEIYDERGSLDKKKFASIIFNNNQALSKANSIIHPSVIRDFIEFAERGGGEVVFVESAILTECELNQHVEKRICVCADEQTRVRRAIERDHSTAEQAKARMDAQKSEKEMMQECEYVVDNSGRQSLIKQLDRILESIG